jgi:hypothetical protein
VSSRQPARSVEDRHASGLLVAAMAGGLEAAEAFSAHRRARVVLCKDVAELTGRIRSDPGPEGWLLSVGSQASVADLAEICTAARDCRRSVGFIAGWNGPHDARRHAEKIRSYAWAAPARALLWHNTGFGGLLPGTAGRLTVAPAADQIVEQRLRDPCRLVALSGHGLGADVQLGSAFLCTLVDHPDAGSEVARGLPCHNGGPCTRHATSAYAVDRKQRLSPRVVAADVVFLAHCRGLLAGGQPVSASWSVAHAIACGSWGGGILTCYRDTATPRAYGPWIWLMLEEGLSLGEICGELNRDAQATEVDAPWLLLGDPTVRFEQAEAPLRSPLSARAGLVAEGQLRARPGTVVRLPPRRSSSEILLLRGEGGVPLTPSEWFCAELDDGTRLALYLGSTLGICDLSILPIADYPLKLQILRTIAAGSQRLAFARRFVEMLGIHRPQLDEGTQRSLALELGRRICESENMATDLAVARRCSGVESGILRKVRIEETSWEMLCDGLLRLLVLFAITTIDGAPSMLYQGACLEPGTVTRHESACNDCGMTQVVRHFNLAETRRITTCYGCGLRSDVPHQMGDLVLDGPATVSNGRATEYTARWSLQARDQEPHYVSGCLAVEQSPFHPGVVGSSWRGWVDGSDASIPLELRIAADTAPGLYVMTVPLVVDGSIAYCRRPIFVVGPPVHS